MAAVNSAGGGIGTGIGLSAQVPNLFDRVSQMAENKQRMIFEANQKAKERAEKIKDFGLETFIKDVEPDYTKINPVYGNVARDAAHDFMVNAYELYTKTGSPQEFTMALSQEANKAKQKFAGIYQSSDQLNTLVATPDEKLTPTQQKYKYTTEAAMSKGDINDLNMMWAQIPDEKREIAWSPYNGTPGSGLVKMTYQKSGQDPDEIAAKEAKDLPTYSEGKGQISRLGNKTFSDIPLIPFQNDEQANNYTKLQGLPTGSIPSIETKVNSILKDPKYLPLQQDWFHLYYGDEPGERNSDGSLNMDKSVMDKSLRDYLTQKLTANQPKQIKTREATDQEQKEWQYKLQHPDAFNNANSTLPSAPYKATYPNNETQSSPWSVNITAKNFVPPQNSLVFNNKGVGVKNLSIGANAVTGPTHPTWIRKDNSGQYIVLTDDQIEDAKNHMDTTDAFPIMMTDVQIPISESETHRQGDPTDNTSDTKTDKGYDTYMIPTAGIIEPLAKSGGEKMQPMYENTLRQGNNDYIQRYIVNLKNPKALKNYEDFNINFQQPASDNNNQPANKVAPKL